MLEVFPIIDRFYKGAGMEMLIVSMPSSSASLEKFGGINSTATLSAQEPGNF